MTSSAPREQTAGEATNRDSGSQVSDGPTIAFSTLGCKLNQAEIELLAWQLAGAGYSLVAPSDRADIYILNTCTVTAAADDDVRQAVRRVRRENPKARILVTGCYAQRAPEELAALEGVTWVVGNSHKTRIPEILSPGKSTTQYHGQIHVGDIFAEQEFLAALRNGVPHLLLAVLGGIFA